MRFMTAPLIPTAAENAAAVAVAVPTNAEITALLGPNHGPYKTGELTGSASYTILDTLSNQRVTLYGFTVSADIACTVTWWSGGVLALTDVHPLPASGSWTVSPSTVPLLKTNLEDALVLRCSSVIAKLRVTYWAAYTAS